MSYQYNAVDIIVGVGVCAILGGALLLFGAANGLFTAGVPPAVDDAVPASGTAMLQPALGQAIVERALLQFSSDRMTADATAQWTQAMNARASLAAFPGGPFGWVRQQSVTIPAAHDARVQAVMGRAIVNFTRRGITSGLLTADQYLSDYNSRMIAAAEQLGHRLDSEFTGVWQGTLGRWIVEAAQRYAARERAIQEQLGMAIVRLVQARTVLEDAWAANQYQLGSLIATVDRSRSTVEPMVQLATADVHPAAPLKTTGPVAWSGIPFAYLILALLALGIVFFSGLKLSAMTREARMAAERQRDAARWVYRMAA